MSAGAVRPPGGRGVVGGRYGPGVSALDVSAYLARLGVDHTGPPSVAGLRALHRAHVERVPYENLEIQLGRPTSVDPYESAARIRRGRGGYCYHLNGAFAVLLSHLGYRVSWHVGGVQRRDQAAPVGATGNHLALTVRGLPAPECPDGVWLVDVGLGDGPYEPLPLRPGTYRQGPFVYRLAWSRVVPGGWRLEHDPAGSFAGLDVAPAAVGPARFAAMHRYLSTSPDSPFVRVATAQLRRAEEVSVLRGCVFTRTGWRGRQEREITTMAEWYGLLADEFGLLLDDLDAAARESLWRRVRTAHQRWTAVQQSPPPAVLGGEASPAPRPDPAAPAAGDGTSPAPRPDPAVPAAGPR